MSIPFWLVAHNMYTHHFIVYEDIQYQIPDAQLN